MSNFTDFDMLCMQRALVLAKQAGEHAEVPVGAVLVDNATQEVIGEGFNQPIMDSDPTAHAEIKAMRMAAKKINNYRLINTSLYVTLEPCAMCAGAMLHARITRLVYATKDMRAGAIDSAINLFAAAPWNHSINCAHGLLAEDSAKILREFFQARR